jgi:hypothetical protein
MCAWIIEGKATGREIEGKALNVVKLRHQRGLQVI